MKFESLLRGWSLMRIMRLALGILFAIQAISFHEAIAGVIAVFFLVQAITNAGCCGAEGCVAPGRGQNKNEGADVTFEEIKINE